MLVVHIWDTDCLRFVDNNSFGLPMPLETKFSHMKSYYVVSNVKVGHYELTFPSSMTSKLLQDCVLSVKTLRLCHYVCNVMSS